MQFVRCPPQENGVDPRLGRDFFQLAQRETGWIQRRGLHQVHLGGPTQDETYFLLGVSAGPGFKLAHDPLNLTSPGSPARVGQPHGPIGHILRIVLRCVLQNAHGRIPPDHG